MTATNVVGHVGRKGVRFALVADRGGLLPASTRLFPTEQASSVSGSLSAFQRSHNLEGLPQRLGLAVAGLARGDVISITHTRWFVSRSGLQAMLGRPPLILNDFEAEAWALAGKAATFSPIGSLPAVAIERPGTYCVIGMTSGLGVAIMTRERSGEVHVRATEAGHAGFAPCSRAIADLVATIFPGRYPVIAEHLLSASGVVAIYNALAVTRKSSNRMARPEDITRQGGGDPLAREACELLCRAFWSFVGDLVLIQGAWMG